MKIFEKLDDLKQTYLDDMAVRTNGTVLLGLDTIPVARHMLFKPLDDNIIETYLTSQYANTFPPQYIQFLKYSNGANLFMVKVWHTAKREKIATTSGFFTIYGLPRTPPFARKKDQEEPFDLRTEDSSRHKETPFEWLKCASYTRNYDIYKRFDLFIDTKTGKVYSCERNTIDVVESWDTLDDALCAIFDSFPEIKPEYDF